MLTRSHTARHTLAHDILNIDFDANNCIIEAGKPQALDNLSVPQSTLELLKDKKFDHCCYLLLETDAGDLNTGFNESEDSLLRCRCPSIPELQQIATTHCLKKTVYKSSQLQPSSTILRHRNARNPTAHLLFF